MAAVEVHNWCELDKIVANLEKQGRQYQIYDKDEETVLDIRLALFPLTIEEIPEAGWLRCLSMTFMDQHAAVFPSRSFDAILDHKLYLQKEEETPKTKKSPVEARRCF